MKNLTIATFNAENLFTRFKFGSGAKPAKVENAVKNGFIIEKELFQRILEPEKKLTAAALKATGADIVGLQEIENLDTLKSFNSQYQTKYPYQYLIDGNDPRLIDVAVLSKLEARHLITHQFDKKGSTKIFSRDCLEVEFDAGGTPFTVFVNHFKSMMDGREETAARRRTQAERVVDIVKAKYGSNPANENFVILGDLNDYLPGKALEPLAKLPWLENVVTRLPKAEQWTHWWDRTGETRQLDYLWLSKRLATNSPGVPSIIRKGLDPKAKVYSGPYFSSPPKKGQAASDHCPVAMKVVVK